ncbi:tetratricopeptide repeat protein [bacterium]|nr:tetratricopeptide repeat protein [bacterium]
MIEIRRHKEEEVEELDPKQVFEEAFISEEEAIERIVASGLDWQFLVGAGVSQSAGMPVSKEIVDEISVKVYEKTHPAQRGLVNAEDIADWLSKEKWFNEDYQYITCLEKEYPANTLRREYFGEIMEGKDPSPSHFTLALAVKFGKINPLVHTTNWDTLLEDAFYLLRGVTCIPIKDVDMLSEIKDDARHYILKIHGSYDSYNVTYLREGMGKLHDDMKEKLRETLKNVGLVVVGYAGLEYSLMNVLMELVEEDPEVLNKGLIWAFKDNRKRPPVQIMQLLLRGRKAGKDFRIFEIGTSDGFFEQLGKKFGLPAIEEEMKYTFSFFNHSSYSDLKPRTGFNLPKVMDFVSRDLIDEGFLISDFNEILEMNKSSFKDLFKKKAEREKEQRDFEQRMLVNAFNDLKRGIIEPALGKLNETLKRFPRSESGFFGKGWAYLELGNLKESIKFLKQALELDPKNRATWLTLALAYNKAGDHKEEINCWEKAAAFKGAEEYMYYNMALAYHYLGDREAEREGYLGCLAKAKRHADSWYNLGILHYEDGYILDALACFQNAFEASSKHAYAWYNSGIILGKVGQNNRALEFIEKAYELTDEVDILYNRGCALCNTKNWDDAIENYGYYIEHFPDDTNAWNNLGLAYYFVEKMDKAIDLFNRVLDEKPDYAKVYYNRARAYWKQGELNKALDDFSKCIELEIEYDLGFYMKSRLLHELERFEEEIEMLEFFISRNPEDHKAWYELGRAYRSLSEIKESEDDKRAMWTKETEAYLKSIEISPLSLDVWLDLGIAYNNLDRNHDAIDCFERIVRHELRNPEVYYNWALSFDQLEDYLKAIEHYDRVIKLKPDHVNAWLNKGTILAKLEQYAKAIDCYEEVLRIDPKNKLAWMNKGLALVPLKDFADASEVLLEGIKNFPDDHMFPLNYAYLTLFTNERELGHMMLWRVGQIDPDALKVAEESPELRDMFPIPKGIEGPAREYFKKLLADTASADA